MEAKIDTKVVKNVKKLNIDFKLFLSLIYVADDGGMVELGKSDFANEFDVTEQTISRYLRLLVSSNIIKFKYSGIVYINPDFFYKGKPEDMSKYRERYLEEKSDMKGVA